MLCWPVIMVVGRLLLLAVLVLFFFILFFFKPAAIGELGKKKARNARDLHLDDLFGDFFFNFHNHICT